MSEMRPRYRLDGGPRAAVIDPPKHLTPEQKRDFRTLVRDGGFTRAQALEIITRPRRRLTATPPRQSPQE